MALTEIPSELSSTPSIVDGGNATAITIDGSENVLVNTANAGASGLSLSNGTNLSFAEGANSSIANLFRQSSSAASFLGSGYRYSANANKAESSYAGAWGRTAIGVGYGAIKFYADAAATVAVGTDITPTERVRITPNGITFNGDTAAANALDDAEEGYWQPTLLGTTGTITDGAVGLGSYTKIGNLIHLSWYVVAGGLNGATGNLQIGNLPYIALSGGTTNSRLTTGSCMTNNLTIPAGKTWVVPYIPHAGDTIFFYGSGTGAIWAPVTVDGTFNMIGEISYRTV